MFVKQSWNTYKGKRHYQHHLAESYRDPNGVPRHHLLMNLTPLPAHVIEAIRQSLKTGQAPLSAPLKIVAGDTVRGAGLLAITRTWKATRMDEVLKAFTPAQRTSVQAMVAQRILQPGSKLSLKDQFRDTIWSRVWSAKRLDEEELYRVMDILNNQFYAIQERLQKQRSRSTAPILCLYDITSTYFEGTEAEEGEYGFSRDKRWDRYQIVIGLVCDEDGLPLTIEVWPGNTADKTTVIDRIKVLRERFGLKKAVFVGDRGMYSEANIKALEEAGFDYILGCEWRRERQQLEQKTFLQLELFDQMGVVEWIEYGIRYIGCASELRRERAARLREVGIKKALNALTRLAKNAASGRRYSWARLTEKWHAILDSAGVRDLWQIWITPLEPMENPDQRIRLQLNYMLDEQALKRRQVLEGKYVLQTSLPADVYSAGQVDQSYRNLQKVERAWRHIKSFLRIRPIYHYKKRRVRAHVLICFLAYYLVKIMELELREKGETKEVELLLKEWDHLRLVELRLGTEGRDHRDWQWSLGMIGNCIREKLMQVGWWSAIDATARSLAKSIPA